MWRFLYHYKDLSDSRPTAEVTSVTLPFLVFLASTAGTIDVSAVIPPNCGVSVSASSVGAWCNADQWTVVEESGNGSETVVWHGSGLGSVTLPTDPDSSYRLDIGY